MKRRSNKPLTSIKTSNESHLKAFAIRNPDFVRELLLALSLDLGIAGFSQGEIDSRQTAEGRAQLYIVK